MTTTKTMAGTGAKTAWRDGVRVVRASSVQAAVGGPQGGRATLFDFTGPDTAGGRTWMGVAAVPPLAATGTHHHGRHEVAIYVIRGRGEIRWGERLEYATPIHPGDAVYFAPFVPHQERNVDAHAMLELLAVRSDNERIAVKLDQPPVEAPEVID